MVGLTGASFGAMFTFHQPFALELGIPQVRGFFLAYAGVALTVRLLVVGFGQQTSRYHLALGSLSVYVASVLWMADLAPGLLAWIGAVYGLAHGLFYPALSALIIADAGEHDRGKRMGIFNGAFNGGFCIAVLRDLW